MIVPAYRASLRDAIALYDGESFGIRSFVRARDALAPLAAIERLVPASGRILDAGCGHGLFANYLALMGPAREVHGVEPSAAKIEVAQRVGRRLANVEYHQGYVQDEPNASSYRAITILDVLYLVPSEVKAEILRACHRLLEPGGVLVLKTNDTWPRWKYQVAKTQEQVMTGVGLTMTDHGIHFWGRRQYWDLLQQIGFEVQFVDLNTWLPYPHVAFLATKASYG